ncbi:MAG: glycosyltransferase family 4 protein [Candidatus Bathyarchaeia archaeon]
MFSIKILFVVNAEWYFWSHRLSLAKALQAQGADVIITAAVERGYDTAIREAGFRFIPLRLQRRSMNLVTEIISITDLWRLYNIENPDIVHHFTIKPVIYGSLIGRLAGVPHIINTIPGLGYTFLNNTWKHRLLRRSITTLYRLALRDKRIHVIFQNPEDCAYFIENRLIERERTSVIRGSGVDIMTFQPAPEPDGVPVVLMAARMLWDKGVAEFVEAAQLVRGVGISCRFVLVGVPDTENPNQVSEFLLRKWNNAGIIEWWGLRNDMPTVLKQATIVTLPSYYPEGVPKVLLEAAATARAIITTDTPGCREIVKHNVSGLLIPPRNSKALADAICFALVNPDSRRRWGQTARKIVENEFRDDIIISQTLDVYRRLIKS